MSLYNYLVKSDELRAEILMDFHPEHIEQLYIRVKELGRAKYLAFYREHRADILKYISLSRSQRKQKKWVNHPDILLIRLIALQISSSTVELLNDMIPLSAIVDNGSYRQFHSIAAQALSNAFAKPPFLLFPFEGYDNPFLIE